MGTDLKSVRQTNVTAKLCFINTKPTRLDRLVYWLKSIDVEGGDLD